MHDATLLPTCDGGLFTTQQAQQVGLRRRALQQLVRNRVIDHVCRGVYARAQPDLSREEAHLRLARAGLLLYPEAVLSHVSAVLAHGLPVYRYDLTRATLARQVDKEVLTRSFRFRPGPLEFASTPHGAAVSAATALVHFTLDAGPLPGVVAADKALHEGIVSEPDLERAAESVNKWPRSGRVKTMLAMVDARSESVGETRLRVHMAAAGITLVPQVEIVDAGGAFVARVDFVVEGTKVVVEFDGKVKYTDGGADALFAEKRREDRLRRLGYVVVRVTWSDLDDPGRIVGWIRHAVAAA